MLQKLGSSCILAFVFLFLDACGPTPSPQSPTPTLTPALTPYLTATPTSTAATGTGAGPATSNPLPTPTPFLYTIAANDTCIGVAARFDIPLDELLVANPGVDCQFLVVGNTLVIPLGEGSIVALPTPTPAQVGLAEPDCYPTTDGGLWCFALVENTLAVPVENLSALVTLHAGADIMATREAVAPLNLLQPGQRLPLMAFFEAPVPSWDSAQADLLSALEVALDSPRYLAAVLEDVQVEIAPGGQQAAVSGSVKLSSETATANLVWILAVAHDAGGRVVGVRRWESSAPLVTGEVLPFSFEVYSLGASIEEVRLLLEARP